VILSGVVAGQLSVYKNKEAFQEGANPLEIDVAISGLGISTNEALYVIAPQGISLLSCLLFN
jgi:hypothetical protein